MERSGQRLLALKCSWFVHSVLLAPDAELIQHLHQRLAPLGQGLFHLGWNLGVDLPVNQPVGFQHLEVLAQGAIRDLFQISLEQVGQAWKTGVPLMRK